MFTKVVVKKVKCTNRQENGRYIFRWHP